MTTKVRTVFRVKLRLASFAAEEMAWQRLIVDRPSAEDASELIKWAHRLDRENNVTRPFLQNCVVERKKAPDDTAMPPLDSVIASLEAAFSLHKPPA